jgi:hypothetical protein
MEEKPKDSMSYVFPVFWNGNANGGISKREYYAAMAMMGLMDPCQGLAVADCAALAVSQADALISALEIQKK